MSEKAFVINNEKLIRGFATQYWLFLLSDKIVKELNDAVDSGERILFIDQNWIQKDQEQLASIVQGFSTINSNEYGAIAYECEIKDFHADDNGTKDNGHIRIELLPVQTHFVKFNADEYSDAEFYSIKSAQIVIESEERELDLEVYDPDMIEELKKFRVNLINRLDEYRFGFYNNNVSLKIRERIDEALYKLSTLKIDENKSTIQNSDALSIYKAVMSILMKEETDDTDMFWILICTIRLISISFFDFVSMMKYNYFNEYKISKPIASSRETSGDDKFENNEVINISFTDEGIIFPTIKKPVGLKRIEFRLARNYFS